jgi:hypothetical protein
LVKEVREVTYAEQAQRHAELAEWMLEEKVELRPEKKWRGSDMGGKTMWGTVAGAHAMLALYYQREAERA